VRLKVRRLGISTAGPLIAVLNEDDALAFDLHPADRIKIQRGRKEETVVLDLADDSVVPKGHIGVYEEVGEVLHLKDRQAVSVRLANKPLSLAFIKRKLDGKTLSKKEIDQIVWDIVHNKLSTTELTFFVAATYCNPNTMNETIWLTEAMTHEGSILHLGRRIVMDKHSIGGIPGNRTTMILVPIMAAAGYTMPKTSSRAITSPAGTADTMEVLAEVEFSLDRMKDIIRKSNACMVWGGALNLAPADDKIINVEKSLSIDAESQLLASIMAKKHSVSSTHVIIDIPMGNHSKIADMRMAKALKRKFKSIGKKLGMKIKVVITDGSQPIGSGIGPALEARDVLKVLRQDLDRPRDLEEKCIMMAGELFKLAGKVQGRRLARRLLQQGKVYEKMKEIIGLQGGKAEITPEEIPLARFEYDFCAAHPGTVSQIDNMMIAKIARVAGAPKNKGAGLYLHKHVGEKVNKGARIFTVYAGSKRKLEFVQQVIKQANTFIKY